MDVTVQTICSSSDKRLTLSCLFFFSFLCWGFVHYPAAQKTRSSLDPGKVYLCKRQISQTLMLWSWQMQMIEQFTHKKAQVCCVSFVKFEKLWICKAQRCRFHQKGEVSVQSHVNRESTFSLAIFSWVYMSGICPIGTYNFILFAQICATWQELTPPYILFQL